MNCIEYDRLWEKMTKEYVVVTDPDRNVLDVSGSVKKLFRDAENPDACIDAFAKAHHNSILEYRRRKYRVEINRAENVLVIIFRECTKEKELEKQVNNLDALAQNYEMLINNFGDSSMYITDARGVTTWVGKQVALRCGVTPEYLIGKSVYEIEREGIFYPSVIVKVLETLRNETIVQDTATGYRSLAMGFPLFDKNNILTKVISFSSRFEKDGDDGSELSSDFKKDIFYPEIISEAPEMVPVKNMAEACSKIDTPVLIYGEHGVCKRDAAMCIHKMSKRCSGRFVVMKADRIPKKDMMNVLFGGENVREGLIRQAEGGTLYITNLHALPYEVQNRLFHVMKGEGMPDDKGMTVYPDVRYIAGSTQREFEVIKGESCQFLFYLFQAMEIEIPPLRKRRSDIMLLLKYYINLYGERYGTQCEFTSQALRLLYAYDWNGNVRELKKFVRDCSFSDGEALIDADKLPEYIVNNEKVVETHLLSLDKVMPLNDALEIMEVNLIKMALNECSNAKEAAKLLKVSQSTLCRKMQRHNITVK